jgi:hypothetical protein
VPQFPNASDNRIYQTHQSERAGSSKPLVIFIEFWWSSWGEYWRPGKFTTVCYATNGISDRHNPLKITLTASRLKSDSVVFKVPLEDSARRTEESHQRVSTMVPTFYE